MKLFNSLNRLRKITLSLWIVAVVGVITYYLLHPGQFTPERIADFFHRQESSFLILFLLLSVARAFVLLPSTPLVIAASLLMPERPWAVLGISLLGIGLASALIYHYSDWLGFRPHFERAAPRHVEKIERWLRHPLGALFVTVWAFFPFVPTDLVCYVAGTVRMPFQRFLPAIVLGELVLCSFYVFGGSWLTHSMLS